MSVKELKLNIFSLLETVTDENLLQEILGLLLEHRAQDGSIVAYTIDGKPLTIEDYQAEINDGIERVEAGDFVTQTEMYENLDNYGCNLTVEEYQAEIDAADARIEAGDFVTHEEVCNDRSWEE